jgi:glycosyltransferase involved in cell wall biosynthesis
VVARSRATPHGVVYLSYDGALDPLGRSQVVPLVEGLSLAGVPMHLLTFEKPERWREASERESLASRLRDAGVRWTPLAYHKRPNFVATLWDLARAFALLAVPCARRRVRLVHARSYPPALVAWLLWRVFGVPYLFDMRGLYADERVEAGLWRADSRLYRMTKWLERRLLGNAAVVVTLTRASVPILLELERLAGGGPEPVVVPTTVDLDLFRPSVRRGAPPTLAYFGSVGGWYLVDEMLAFGRAWLEGREDARLLWLVNGLDTHLRDDLLERASRTGVDLGRFVLASASYESLPGALAEATATYAFIRPAFSKVASAATKVSESFALGLPVAVNEGVGDSAEVVRRDHVGVVVDLGDRESWRQAVLRLFELSGSEETTRRCREVARREHCLRSALERYLSLYDSAPAYVSPGSPR